jgi:hypothetical protein
MKIVKKIGNPGTPAKQKFGTPDRQKPVTPACANPIY